MQMMCEIGGLMTPNFFYAIFFRAVKGSFLVIVKKKFQFIFFLNANRLKFPKERMLNFKNSYFKINPYELHFFQEWQGEGKNFKPSFPNTQALSCLVKLQNFHKLQD